MAYCKPPFGGADRVLEYLGRYTHRVAIANHRLVGLEEGRVTFWWRDYSDEDKKKLMSLESHEFIRRFLLHVLPDRYVKIRHYGILGNRSKAKLRRCQEILGIEQKMAKHDTYREEILLKLTGYDLSVCPSCGKGKMVRREIMRPLVYPGFRKWPPPLAEKGQNGLPKLDKRPRTYSAHG